MKLSAGQKSGLAEFCTNFAVAWLTAGIVAQYVSGQNFVDFWKIALLSGLYAGFLLMIMLLLMRGVKK